MDLLNLFTPSRSVGESRSNRLPLTLSRRLNEGATQTENEMFECWFTIPGDGARVPAKRDGDGSTRVERAGLGDPLPPKQWSHAVALFEVIETFDHMRTAAIAGRPEHNPPRHATHRRTKLFPQPEPLN